MQVGKGLYVFNPKNADNRRSVEKAYREGIFPLKL
jgi:hypothetical protein